MVMVDEKKLIFKLLAIVCLLSMPLLSLADNEKRFYVYNAANGLADNSAQTIKCTKTGRLVITTMGQINFFDGQQFSYIDPTTENTYPLSAYRGHAHLYFDKYHHLWLKNKHSVTCVNLTREQFVGNVVDEFKDLGQTDSKVTDIFVDQRGVVWMLTDKGVFSSDSKRYYEVRKSLNLQDLMVYDDKYLMLYYENGELDVYQLDTDKLVHTSSAYSEEYADRYSSSSVIHQDQNIFYQIRNGNNEAILVQFDFYKKNWKTILQTPYYLSNIAQKDSMLYIPSAYGYWTYDIPTSKLEHIEELTMASGQKLITDINAIEFDRQGGMWVGTQLRGLLYSRPYLAPFQIYTWTDHRATEYFQLLEKYANPTTVYRDKVVNCVYRDSRGWDWVGTSTGLQIYRNKSAHLPQLITRNEGLQNNVIHCVVEDSRHNIWVGTSYGVCCVLIENDKVRYVNRYNEWDGIPKESFVDGRAVCLDNGEIVMQALDHIIVFNPDKMVTVADQYPFEIYPKLVRLFVNGNDVHTGQELDGKVILAKALTHTKEIDLNYNQNSVSLTFSGLNYFRPQQTFYRVRVSGPRMSGVWKIYTPYNSQGLVDGRGQLHLPLASLQPGSYRIEVQTSMLPDKWDSTPYEWIVNIHEPWWRTTGVLALLGLLLFILFCIYIYLYLKNANMKARRNSEEQSVIKRIKNFADRCDVNKGTVLEPSQDDMVPSDLGTLGDLNPKFVKMMSTIIPFVSDKEVADLSMRDLSNQAQMSLQDFYSLLMSNIYKNPRPVVMEIMLERAKELLKVSTEDIAEVSKQCGFVSPNYFIASFYRKYGQTPRAFRKKIVG